MDRRPPFAPGSRALRRSLSAGAVLAGAAISLRALARPLPANDRRLLDWEAVRRTAHGRTGEQPTALAEPVAARLGSEYDAAAAELSPLMAEVVGVHFDGYPTFTVIDRRGFIDRNLVIARRLLEPVEKLRAEIPESRATALGRTVMSRYVGELFGFLSQRVLGQYDPVLMLAAPALGEERDTTALYLVEPNVERFQRSSGAPAESLRRWLILHELTHAWQFEAHPWLREHLGSLMQELLQTELVSRLTSDGPRASRLSASALARLLPGTVQTQLRVAGRIQAVMSVCEGYSNYVMHRVGRRHLEHFDELERAFHERAAHRPPVERAVLAVTGLSMKMRQYEVGERFAEAVHRRGGDELLNRVWDGPAMMPSPGELRDPQRWVRRVA